MKYYDCVSAPNAATRRDAIRVAQLVRHHGQSVREAFTPQAFRGWGTSDIAVLLGHDETKRTGTVTAVTAHGDWWHASFVLDGPYAARAADYIERCGKVSPGFYGLDKDADFAVPISPAHSPTHWYVKARLDEISILPPGAIGWYAGAKVTRAYDSKATPPASSHATTTAKPACTEGEVHIHGGQTIIRHGIGQVLRVR